MRLFRFFNTISDYRCLIRGLNKAQAEFRAAGFTLTGRDRDRSS